MKIFKTLLAYFIFVSAVLAQQVVSSGVGAKLRVLDKVSGQSKSYDLAIGNDMKIGQLTVALRACRYPEGAPSNDAFAYIDVIKTESATSIFSGWIIASAPALNAMEHSRYDVWVLRCKTS